MCMMRMSLAVLCGFFGGCATVNHMAFDKNSNTVNVESKSVVLMTVDVSRPDKSRFEPVPIVLNIEQPDAHSKAERQNFKVVKDQDAVQSDNGHTVFLTRMALAPGPYKLMAITGLARAFPISGLFQVPLITKFSVPPHSVVYIGRVTATLRSRKGGEFRAGPLIPLIDQAIAGMSNSTWDVVVEDRSDVDLPLYHQNFKAVESISIKTLPLPPFDRVAVQSWWDDTSPKEKGGDKESTAGADRTPAAANSVETPAH